MTCEELEKAAVPLVLSRIGALIDEDGLVIVDEDGDEIVTEFPTVAYLLGVSDGTEFGTLNDKQEVAFHIYRGQNNGERKTPSVVISCDESHMDIDSGNDLCQLEVDVLIPADDHEGQEDQIDLAHKARDAMTNIFRNSDLADHLNAFSGPLFSAIGVESVANGRLTVERTFIHRLSINILAANCNLVTT